MKHLPRRHSHGVKSCTSHTSTRLTSTHSRKNLRGSCEKESYAVPNISGDFATLRRNINNIVWSRTKGEQNSSSASQERGDSSDNSRGSQRLWNLAFFAYIFDTVLNKTSSESEVLHPLKIWRFRAAVWRTIHTPRDAGDLSIGPSPANQPAKGKKQPEMGLPSFDAKTQAPDIRKTRFSQTSRECTKKYYSITKPIYNLWQNSWKASFMYSLTCFATSRRARPTWYIKKMSTSFRQSMNFCNLFWSWERLFTEFYRCVWLISYIKVRKIPTSFTMVGISQLWNGAPDTHPHRSWKPQLPLTGLILSATIKMHYTLIPILFKNTVNNEQTENKTRDLILNEGKTHNSL